MLQLREDEIAESLQKETNKLFADARLRQFLQRDLVLQLVTGRFQFFESVFRGFCQNTAPVVSVTPNDWTKENSVSVTWSGISDLNELSRVEYSIDGGAYVSTGITDYAYSGYTIDISSLTS